MSDAKETPHPMPRVEGHRAYRDGAERADCPYERGTVDAIGWTLGWEDAELGIPEHR